ncbi:MAG TPA: hypothetical protein VK886_23210 [Vicinamibacterales bacterium]|nr:hypothetical protein [Vicinamibacterales bacterium]
MIGNSRPDRGEAAEYYFKYIDLVPDGDILAILEAQLPETLALLERVPAERVDYRYTPDKWTVREVECVAARRRAGVHVEGIRQVAKVVKE